MTLVRPESEARHARRTVTSYLPWSLRPLVSRRTFDRAPWLATVLVLVGQGIVLADVEAPVARPLLGLVLLLGIPTLVLARRTERPTETPLHAALYAFTVVLLGTIVGGLAVNTFLPLLGYDRPLDRPVVVTVSTIVDVGLLWWRRDVALLPTLAVARRVPGRVWSARVDPAVLVAVMALATAVAGAIRLNNGESGWVASTGHGLVVVAVSLLLVRRGTLVRDAAVVYLAGLALLLGTSLRGWFVTGHDIQREYAAFLLAHGADHWQMGAYRSAYNACLSVTILPSLLAEMTGVSGTWVFKVVLQVLAALLPLVVLLVARRWVSPRLAVLGTLLFLVYPTYATDLSYLVRQEVAYLFLGVLLLASTEKGWSMRQRRIAAAALGIGVVLSHYSTTYLLIIALGIALAGVLGTRLLAAVRKRPHAMPRLTLVHPLVVLAILAGTWAWTGPATQSGGHFKETVSEAITGIVDGGAGPGSSDLGYGLMASNQATPQERFDDYVQSVEKTRSDEPADARLLPSSQVTTPKVLERAELPLTGLGQRLESVGVDVTQANSLLRLAAAAAFQLFLVVGVAALVLRRRNRLAVGPEARWLVIGSVGALAVVVLVPGMSAEYGVLRAFQQTLIMAMPAVVLGAVTCFGMFRRKAAAVASVAVVTMAASLSGALPAALGGYYAQLSQSSSGQYYDLHYVTAPEVAAAEWLGPKADGEVQSEVISDKVAVGRLKNMVPPSVTVVDEFFPGLLRKGAYVYLPAETARHDRATVFYTGDLLTYRYPVGVLDQNLSVVYDSGAARIYR